MEIMLFNLNISLGHRMYIKVAYTELASSLFDALYTNQGTSRCSDATVCHATVI